MRVPMVGRHMVQRARTKMFETLSQSIFTSFVKRKKNQKNAKEMTKN